MSRYSFPEDYVPSPADEEVAHQLNHGASPDALVDYVYLKSCASRDEASRVEVRTADNGPSGATIAMVFDAVERYWLVYARTH